MKTPVTIFVSLQERTKGILRHKRKKHYKISKKAQLDERMKTPGNLRGREAERRDINVNRLPSSHTGSPRDSSKSSSDKDVESDCE